MLNPSPITRSREWRLRPAQLAALFGGVLFLGCSSGSTPPMMQPNGGGTGGMLGTGGSAIAGDSATGGMAGSPGTAGAAGSAGAGGLSDTAGSGGMNTATGGTAGSATQNPTTYPGPVVVPSAPQACVDDPQTLAEAGACAGVRVGTALSRGIAAPYPDIFVREFNAFTPENDTKIDQLQPTQGTWTFTNSDVLLGLATQTPVWFKGHTLIWHSQPPPYLPAQFASVAELDAYMKAHIDAVLAYYGNAAFAWEVVNEALDETAPRSSAFSTPGGVAPNLDFVGRAFRMARAADPDALLYYNDFNLETDNGPSLDLDSTDGGKAGAVARLVRDMLAAGDPIDGVAIQGHLRWDITSVEGEAEGYYSPGALRRNMQRFASLGIKVNLSEFDLRIPQATFDAAPGGAPASYYDADREYQIYYDFVTVCLEEPNCDAITFWGISDANSWISASFPSELPISLYDATFQERPAYQGAMQALLDGRP